MQHPKLNAMLLALAFGAALTAGAQTVIQTLPPDDGATIVVSPPSAVVIEPAPAAVVRVAPVPVPDPTADSQCRMLAGRDYWDCVNSHHGG